MDAGRFDALTRKLSRLLTRRQLFKAAAALAPAPTLPFLPAAQPRECPIDSCTGLSQSQCCCCGPGCDPACASRPLPERCPPCPMPCTGQISCDPGFTACCCGDEIGDCCKDLQNDPEFCGSCFAAACAGTCSGGVCSCADANKTFCPGIGCVNLDDDENHCGACDAEPCLGRCIDGECTCRGTKELCSTGCADLTSDSRHCGQCEHACAATETCVEGVCCPAGHGMCWDQCIDLREDRNHCGACGHACTTLQECIDGVCVREDPPTDGCSAQSLRLWINAFYPGVVDGFTRQRLIDLDDVQRLESVSSPRLNETANPCSDAQVCLRTDRRPDLTVDQDWQSFFSRDAAAPSMAHAELEIDMSDRDAIRAVVPQVSPRYGLLQHVRDTGVGEDQVAVAEVTCNIPLTGTPRWFHDFNSTSIDQGIRFNVRATWDAWNPSQCLAPSSQPGACPVDEFAVCPLGSIQGSMVVRVLPDEGVVSVTIVKLEVPQYPVIEIYAALDDGHVIRLWASEAEPVPLAELRTKPPTVIENLSVEIPCGCGPCDAGETTCEIDPTCVSDAYFILSSSEDLRLNETTLGQAPNAEIDADGPVTVTRNGLPEPVFSGQDAGNATRTPPIGFAGKRGDRLDVQIACPNGASSCSEAMAGPLFLYRFDSLFAQPTRQVLIPGRVPLPLDATHQRHVIELSRATKPGGVCRRLESGLTQVCTDILSNQVRCGGLSDTGEFACGESEVCLNGVCRCPIHMARVGPRQCADLLNDDQHCGEPQNACPAGTHCVIGECRG